MDADRLMVMKVSGMQIATQSSDVLRDAYRTTFEEYARKLGALQLLMSFATSESGQIEAALLEVEKARIAHSCARDRLATELMRPSSPPEARGNEHHIRETARLLWELAGRPEGTAECDWHRAERLVHTASAS